MPSNAGRESGRVVNNTVPFLALHKERYVFPVMLTVAKVSGIGEDSCFMGIIEVRGSWAGCVWGGRLDTYCWSIHAHVLLVTLQWSRWHGHAELSTQFLLMP